MTSHVDPPSTVLPLWGVENPTEDYGAGHDLFDKDRRDYVVAADWKVLEKNVP